MRWHYLLISTALLTAACTQETQNQLGRGIQNWTGTDGIMEVYAGETLIKRFLKVDKLSTAIGTSDDGDRSYRYGYGVLDTNLNGMADRDESKVYFEVGGYATYVFHEDPG